MKKIIILSLVVMIFISNVNVYAFENIAELQLEKIRDCESLLTYKNRIIKTSYIEAKIDGINYPCYCINPDLDGVGELGNYNVKVEKCLEKDSLVYKAIINGYPYKTLEQLEVNSVDEAYTATKQAVYSMIYGRYKDMSNYGKVDNAAGERTLRALNKIIENALKEETKTEFSQIEEISKWQIRDNICFKKYKLDSNTIKDYDIKIEGNVPDTLRVTKNKELFEINIPIKDMTESVDFIIKIEGKNETKPVLYGETLKENSQNYAIAGVMLENKKIEYEDSYDKNNTMLKIIKKDDKTGEILSNVKFRILDEKREVIIDKIITDENGEVILDNFLPGKYYLEEIETLEEYEIHKELIEMNVEYDKENIIIVKNIKKEIPEESDIPKLPKTGF